MFVCMRACAYLKISVFMMGISISMYNMYNMSITDVITDAYYALTYTCIWNLIHVISLQTCM